MLTVVGTGIQLGQISVEAKQYIVSSDKVFYVVADLVTADWIKEVNSSSESLSNLYDESRPRLETYKLMVEAVINEVKKGKSVCAVFYGHPGVFAMPSHESVRRARALGVDTRMIPAISAEDCVFADIGIDPGSHGCLSYEATDFIVRGRIFDTFSHLIIWQIGVIGELGYRPGANGEKIGVLIDRLLERFDEAHEVIVYEAASISVLNPRMERVRIGDLGRVSVSSISTLYVPPVQRAPIDVALAGRLGFAPSGQVT